MAIRIIPVFFDCIKNITEKALLPEENEEEPDAKQKTDLHHTSRFTGADDRI